MNAGAFAFGKTTSVLADALCFKCHPSDKPRHPYSQPRPGMAAKAKGVVWEVKQVGLTEGEGGRLVLWANLVPTSGGEQRAAYSEWVQWPVAYLLDNEAVTFEG